MIRRIEKLERSAPRPRAVRLQIQYYETIFDEIGNKITVPLPAEYKQSSFRILPNGTKIAIDWPCSENPDVGKPEK